MTIGILVAPKIPKLKTWLFKKFLV
jgi:hypothetical protein